MTLDALIMLLGALVALTPFLGFPNSWDRVILLVAGVFIIILGIIVRRRSGKRSLASSAPRVFEVTPTPPSEPIKHDQQ